MKVVAALLLLALATVGQPTAAQQQTSCDLPAIACAACCAVNPCCISSRSDESPQLPPATATSTAEPLVLAQFRSAPLLRDLSVRDERRGAIRRSDHVPHSPLPLALNCVQLI